jgi:hypothetical protein
MKQYPQLRSPRAATSSRRMSFSLLLSSLLSASWLGCGSDSELPAYGEGTASETPPKATSTAASAKPTVPAPTPEIELPGTELEVEIPAAGTTYVDLSALTTTSAAGEVPTDWDLSFHGFDVFTNSGASGPGEGGGFGPNAELDFLFEQVPQVPFLREDVTGGAFLDWYYYDGEVHRLWSLNDIYAVKSLDRLYKVQILSYYGEQLGAPVSALYQVRYAQVTEEGNAETQTINALDGTAGYPKIDDSKPSGCLQLATGDVSLLPPDEARGSSDWDLCFRGDSISVNGEMGGPGNVGALPIRRVLTDWDGSFDAVKALTPEQSLAGFDKVDFDMLSDPTLEYRGDRIISIFSSRWLDRDEAGTVSASAASWLVRSRDGKQFYSVLIRDVESDSSGVRRLKLRVHALVSAKP